MKICVTGILVALALLLPGWAAARPPDPRWEALADTVFRPVARAGELPAAALATTLAEDGAGFLWIGTHHGLLRWDGYQFRVYRADPQRPGSLPDSDITVLGSDAHGRLWIGTRAGGVTQYDPAHDRFIALQGASGPLDLSVNDVAADGEGGAWVATDAGLDHLLPGGTVRHLLQDRPGAHGLTEAQVDSLLQDGDTLWVGTAAGLARLTLATLKLTPVALPTPGFVPAHITTLFKDSHGRLWIGTRHHGAFVIAPGAAGARPVRDGAVGRPPPDEEVQSIAEVPPREIWLGTRGEGIVMVEADTGRTRRLLHDPALAEGLADDNVLALHRDRAGLVWVATPHGLAFHDPHAQGIHTLLGGAGRRTALRPGAIGPVLELPDGRLWLAVDGLGIDILDPVAGRVASLRADPARPRASLPRQAVHVLARAEDGGVYAGTGRGLYHLDTHARHVSRVEIPGRDPSAPVRAVLLQPGALWIGGPDGLSRLALHTHIPQRAALPPRLTDPRVSVLAPGPQGSLWVGTENGLNLIDPASGRAQPILPDPPDRTALPAGRVSALLTDRRGRLWVGTLGGGIGVLHESGAGGHHFERLGTQQGLTSGNINRLLLDGDGRIWASTDDGLAVIDPTTLAVRMLRPGDGLPILNYGLGSGTVSAQGELIFGGLQGLEVVDPRHLPTWDYRPPLVITDITLGREHVPVPPGAPVAPVSLAPGTGLAVELAALDYTAPERNAYAYKLEGADPAWTVTDAAHRVVSYPSPPPGEYRLLLRGANRDGVWSGATLAVPVHVLPWWYQTVPFRVAMALMVVALLPTLVQLRMMHAQGVQRQLEQQVSQRTAQLRESQRQLQEMAYSDSLTQLPNRRMFMDELRELLVVAGLQESRFALLLIDLDRLKKVNDTLGHDAGDAVLVECGLRLRGAVRKSDCVARLGGDEFAVLITQNPATADIEGVCQRIIDGFAKAIVHRDVHIQSSPSIGVAVYPEHGTQHDRLYKSADVALYECKRAGGNGWRWYRAAMAAWDGSRLE